MLADLSRKLAFIGNAPVLKISALTGKGVHNLRPVLQEAITQYHRRVPTRDVNRVHRRRPAAPAGRRAAPRCCTRCRAPATRRRSPCSPTASCRRPTSATSSARSARRSSSARRRSSCGCGSARAATTAMPWCDDCEKYWAPSSMTPDGTCPTCGANLDDTRTLGPADERRREDAVALQADDRGGRRVPRLPLRRDVHRLTDSAEDRGVGSDRTADTRAVAQLG